MEECVILPGLPKDVAMLCLARLPFGLHPLLSCVCRSWRRALQLPILFDIRARLGLQEHFLFVMVPARPRKQRSRSSTQFYLIDSRLAKCYPLPPPPRVQGYPYAYACGRHCDVMTVGRQVLVSARPSNLCGRCPKSWLRDCPESWEPLCFDLVSRLWCTQSTPMLESRVRFASATADGYVYVAGGRTDSNIYTKSAERFDLASKRWERIPDMNKTREKASGIAWKGSFWMIGGGHHFLENERFPFHDSAEVWDALKEEWQLIPGFLHEAMYEVAIVKGKLYTLEYKFESEFMLLDETTNLWIQLGMVPYFFPAITDYKLIGAGDKLWVLVEDTDHKGTMYSTDPESLPLFWRLLPFHFERYPSDICVVTL